MTIDDIYRYAEDQGIQVYELPLPGLQSISMPGDELSTGYIGISKDIDDMHIKKESAGHEIGHCVTKSFYNIFAGMDIWEKHERRARIWSYEFFLPQDELYNTYEIQGITDYDVAEHFGVTVDFLRAALEYYQWKALSDAANATE